MENAGKNIIDKTKEMLVSANAMVDQHTVLSKGVSIGNFSVIGEDVSIGENTEIAESVIIRPGVHIGKDVVIHPHAVINSGVTISDRVEIFPCAYIGKEPKGAGALARQPVFEKCVYIGADTSIGPNVVIYYEVEIGEHTLIGDGASIRERCRIGSFCIVSRYVTINYNTKVGNRTKIMDMTHVTGNCQIGDNVFISTMVGMTNDNAMGAEIYNNDELFKGPTVEDNAMIGAGVTLLPHITIGKGAIAGAGSVVTKDVAPGSVVMGVPAKETRKVRI